MEKDEEEWQCIVLISWAHGKGIDKIGLFNLSLRLQSTDVILTLFKQCRRIYPHKLLNTR